MSKILRFWLIVCALPFQTCLLADESTVPGKISLPYPTLNNLAVEWEIDGDDDLDATCEVKFRKTGSDVWRVGMPLRRVAAGSSLKASPQRHWTNRLSGSIFDLPADTEYEIALRLADPDGGDATRIVKTRTRTEPFARKDAPLVNAGLGNLNAAKPGTVVMLEDGKYGAVRFEKDGEPDHPIVYRSMTGKAVFSEISLTDRKWVYLEGLTVNGPVRMNGTEYCAVRRCKISSQFGIKAYKPGMINGCIEDNTIIGIRAWDPAIMGANGENDGEGIQITGSGNVIRFNRVTGFRDCLSQMENDGAAVQMCNDWLNNDIGVGLDDGIEADFAFSNCRILRNRITNCFVGESSFAIAESHVQR